MSLNTDCGIESQGSEETAYHLPLYSQLRRTFIVSLTWRTSNCIHLTLLESAQPYVSSCCRIRPPAYETLLLLIVVVNHGGYVMPRKAVLTGAGIVVPLGKAEHRIQATVLRSPYVYSFSEHPSTQGHVVVRNEGRDSDGLVRFAAPTSLSSAG
jgi:hypothetical protein